MAMFVERNLFAAADQWISNKGDNINKPPSEYFEASNIEGAMLITNGLGAAWGGGLVSRKRPLPKQDGKLLRHLAFRIEFRFPKMTAKNIARHEVDWKVCVKTRPDANTKIRNVANFSTQWSRDSGQFQIDLDPPAWTDTGFVVEEIEPDVWHTQEYRFKFDENARVFTVVSIQYDDQLYMIPARFENVPMQETNWEEISSHQLQNEGYQARSSTLIEYRNGVVAWSDERIAMIPAEGEGWL